MMSREKYVRLQARGGPGWVDLPVDRDVDADAWAAEQVRTAGAGLEPLEWSIGPDAAAAMLAATVRRAQEQHVEGISAHASLAFQPDPIGAVLVVLDAAVHPFEGEPLTLDGLMASLGSGGATVGNLERDRVKLAAGPGVRVRRMFGETAAGEPVDPDTFVEAADVVEGITYVVLPKRLPGFLHVNATWTQVAIGDQLAEQVDALAASIDLEFHQ